MPATVPKITVQATYPLQIHIRISNSAKDPKWSKKERPTKIIIAWNYFLKILQ